MEKGEILSTYHLLHTWVPWKMWYWGPDSRDHEVCGKNSSSFKWTLDLHYQRKPGLF